MPPKAGSTDTAQAMFSDDVVYVAHPTQETRRWTGGIRRLRSQGGRRPGAGERLHGKPGHRRRPRRERGLYSRSPAPSRARSVRRSPSATHSLLTRPPTGRQLFRKRLGSDHLTPNDLEVEGRAVGAAHEPIAHLALHLGIHATVQRGRARVVYACEGASLSPRRRRARCNALCPHSGWTRRIGARQLDGTANDRSRMRAFPSRTNRSRTLGREPCNSHPPVRGSGRPGSSCEKLTALARFVTARADRVRSAPRKQIGRETHE